MVDNVNPTSQFHPYQGSDVTPQTGSSNSGFTSGGLGGMLGKLGIGQSKLGGLRGMLGNTNLRGGLNNVRAKAQANPGMVLGGLAALAIGAGLMRKRSMR